MLPNPIKKVMLLSIIFLFSLQNSVYADTLYLKTGKKVEGKIIERTDKYIKIDFEGLILTFWLDEIERIEAETISSTIPKQTEEMFPSLKAENAESYFKRGTDYLKKSKWNEAITEFKNAISIDSYHVGAYFNLGCAYALTGEYNQAIEQFEKAMPFEIAPFNAFCYFNIAGVYVKQAMAKRESELFKKAAENFEKAAQTLPNFVLAIDSTLHSGTFSSLSSAEPLQNIGKIQYSVSETGTPPDSAMFLSNEEIIGTGMKRVCLFGAEGPPLLYFYRSLACNFLVCLSRINLQKLNITQELLTCFESLLDTAKNESPTRFNKLLEWNIVNILGILYEKNGEQNKAIEFKNKAATLEAVIKKTN